MRSDLATTLIGSLPCADERAAIDRILDGRISIPSWPQLPALGYSESMYVQTGEHLPGLVIDDKRKKMIVNIEDYDPTDIYTAIVTEDVDHFKPSERYHKGLFELLKRDVSGYQGIKGQVTGPISLGLQVQDKDGRAAIYDDAYSEIIRRTVNMAAKWQVRELSKKNNNVIMFFDEPSLTLLGSPFASVSSADAVTWMNEAMDVPGCKKGIHCCGNTDWPMVLSTDADILSFDAYAYSHTVAMFPDELSQFLEKGGILAWGMIPSSDELIETETSEGLVKRFGTTIDRMCEKGIEKDVLLHQSIITPQCGLGGVSQKNMDKAFSLLNELSTKMKKRYSVE